MFKPIIGISGSQFTIKTGVFAGYQRAYVNNNYVNAIAKAGGIPLILPVTENLEDCKVLLTKVDGLLLSGGHDISPHLYGEEPLPEIGDFFPLRDNFEINLIKEAMSIKMPIMGICRGHQLINVALGGSLYQDIKYHPSYFIKHSQGFRPGLGTHTIDITPESKLNKIMNKTTWLVNSHHHQIVKKVANNLIVTATTKDGIIEAMEHKNYPYLLTYQFHPEMMCLENPEASILFTDFINFIKTNNK